ncbi:ester cyclase [Phycicoccus sonneratiae]|uniref:Nuclear transport factor 2 family protein n=1 Tax=Phycicoccus sonneratiae TaxID=2807628 RepID=A0ABS2CHA4_9MICO|nr:nuclear transport factor 2 family protein [Phycicoccus sonneraticus]MBM6399160.1 nuclear transport factor 2 family protein [Phycicoccus sonneraticus]
MDPTELYRRYLRRCNEYRFDELGAFVAADVRVNDAPSDPAAYGAGLRSVVEAYPGFRWHLQHLVVEGDWLAARLVDTFETGDGSSHRLQELAIYRLEEGRIAAVWGDLDPERLPPPGGVSGTGG